MKDGVGEERPGLLLGTIIGLGIGLFCLDLYLPLGVGNGVLYGGLVILSFLLPNRKGPLITAAVCSVLDLSDLVWGPVIDGMPRWMGVTSRLFSLTAIWLPVLFFLHQRRAEERLQRAHDELEARVQARTQELATVNQALVAEIAERMETERSLRTSEAVLQASQRELQQSREDLRALAGQLLTAQEEDRRRISRDLHDDVNQRLAMLAMDLRRMEKEPPTDPEGLCASVRLVSERLTAVSDDVRQMAYRFHPSILDDLGLVKGVRRLVDEFAARTGIKTTYVHKDPVAALPAETTICLYRIVQESLSNIARHAEAAHAEVELICEDDVVSLSVRDDGKGFESGPSAQAGGHLGLLSMKERVRLAKGTFQVKSAHGQGTHVQVEVPLHGGTHV
ncbi:sensor histidine kinase [Nitrospira moscoviensis]|uniref:Oxygen sensor histidine kinase NreB n=1 Tax=Nitrospira moscoviensis TaxID=42253 RepID=A0A0K2GII0_NITMO|nr:sensor histidine kinase [Nitrospira moscoviensis]ALA60402.1 putative Histidine kinase [Nitrospira moscoviensis]